MQIEHFFSPNSGEDQKKEKKEGSSSKIEHFFSPNSGKDQKKRSSARIEHFFPPNLRSGVYPFKLLGDATIGGDTAKLLGGISPPITPGFRHS